MNDHGRPVWTTFDECSFLNNLGIHSSMGEGPDWVLLCLHGWLEGAQYRSDWGEVDSTKAIAHARKLLRLAEGEA